MFIRSWRAVGQYHIFGYPADPYPNRDRGYLPGREVADEKPGQGHVELRTRIYNMEHQKYLDEIASKRKTMVSTGDRSAKIRTYNWPQGRVTDHRINLTLYNLQAIIGGEMDEIIEKLMVEENAEKLKEAEI